MTTPFLDRRGLLMSSLGLAAVAAAPALAATQPFFRRHNLDLGLQIYSLGPNVLDDIPGTLAQAKQAGFHVIEMQGEFSDRDPAALKRQLAQTGLVCRSAQSAFAPAVNVAKLGDDLRGLGVDQCVTYTVQEQVLGHPMTRENRSELLHATADGWKRAGDFLNGKGRVLKQHGVTLCYHNHNMEFAPVGDTTGLALLIKNTDPELVSFQLDIGWCATAGADPIAVFNSARGRFRSAHIKDVKSVQPNNYLGKMDNAIVGQGRLDWAKILPAAYAAGVRRFFIEHEDPNRSLAAVVASRRFASRLVA